MIDFSGYTKANIEAEMLAQVDPNIDTREGSMIQTAVAPGAWFLEGMYLLLDKIQKNAYSETAEGEALDLVAATRAVTRTPATPAIRKGTFLDENGDPMVIPAGSRFKTINGEDSVVFVSGDLIAAGEYELTCETAGIIGNSYVGAILPITAINGLATATIGAIIRTGGEVEDDESLRQRYDLSFEATAFAGNMASYENALLSYPGIGAIRIGTSSLVLPPYRPNAATATIYIVDDNYDPCTQEFVDEVQLYVCPEWFASPPPIPFWYGWYGIGLCPIGTRIQIQTPEKDFIDVTASITWETGRGGSSDIQAVEDAIEQYFKNAIKDQWGSYEIIGYQVISTMILYHSVLVAAIQNVDGVVSVSNVTLNGSSADYDYTYKSWYSSGYIPAKGTVTIT